MNCAAKIPHPKWGPPKKEGTGGSSYGRKLIARLAYDHHQEAKALAECLSQGKDLESTLRSFHGFVYRNFRRILEGKEHYLQTLSRAWHDRSKGINCEDATIINGQLCLALGIKCTVRGIAQMDPNVVNHVFLIVPKNQRTGNLDQGYWTLDSTLPGFNSEATALRTYDVKMRETQVQYYSMNGPKLDLGGLLNIGQEEEAGVDLQDEQGGSGWVEDILQFGTSVLNNLDQFKGQETPVGTPPIIIGNGGGYGYTPPNPNPNPGNTAEKGFLGITSSHLGDGIIALAGIGIGAFAIKKLVA